MPPETDARNSVPEFRTVSHQRRNEIHGRCNSVRGHTCCSRMIAIVDRCVLHQACVGLLPVSGATGRERSSTVARLLQRRRVERRDKARGLAMKTLRRSRRFFEHRRSARVSDPDAASRQGTSCGIVSRSPSESSCAAPRAGRLREHDGAAAGAIQVRAGGELLANPLQQAAVERANGDRRRSA